MDVSIEMVTRNGKVHLRLMIDLSERKSYFLKEIIKNISSKRSLLKKVKNK